MPVPVGGAQVLYDLDADEYFINHDRHERAMQATRLLAEATRRAGRRGRLLDIGSGRGEILHAAASAGWEVIGLEPSPTFAQVARAGAPGVTVLETDVLSAVLPAGSFDVVLLQAVLEHLHDPVPVIAEVSRLLAPRGVFYADVPNELSLYARVGNLYQRLRGRDWVVNLSPTFSPFHVFGFSVRSLRALYRQQGLEPLDFDVRGGHSTLARRPGVAGWLEQRAAAVVTDVANAIQMGTYIASWAQKPA